MRRITIERGQEPLVHLVLLTWVMGVMTGLLFAVGSSIGRACCLAVAYVCYRGSLRVARHHLTEVVS